MKRMHIVPIKELMDRILDFLYKVYDVPPVVPYYRHIGIKNHLSSIISYCLGSLDDMDKFIRDADDSSYMIRMNEGMVMFGSHKDEFKLLLMYIMHYLIAYLPTDKDVVYMLQSVDDTTLVVIEHRLDKISNELVFDHVKEHKDEL